MSYPPAARGRTQHLVLLLCIAVCMSAALVVAALPDKPRFPASAGAEKPESAEAKAIDATSLAPSSRPSIATQPATTRSVATQPSIYPDVSFARGASTRPVPRPRLMPKEIVSDEEIEQGIRLGIEALIDQFDPRTFRLRRKPAGPQWEAMESGLQSLCVYALMQAGASVDDPRLREKSPFMRGLIDGIKATRPDRGIHQTYARALRATALAVFNREEDRLLMSEDVGCLARGHFDGGYGYFSATPTSMSFEFRQNQLPAAMQKWVDHSNSQYGLLGVWSGAEAGIEVPDNYWQLVVDHWTKTQSLDGKWAYMSSAFLTASGQTFRPPVGAGTLSMTAAGTASLFVASEWAERNGKGFKCGREPFSDALKRSLDWWEERDNAVRLSPSAAHWGYTLYGIERVGLASGFKFFGNNDWYRTLSRKVLDTQRQNGAWNNLMDTPYALLFLARGRHPILMNKLRFDGVDDISSDYWANRPNDLAYLSRFVGKQLERPINWQIVPLKKEPTDWLDASILYIASHQRPHFKPYDLDKLRAYVEAGGMIFTNADSDAESGDPLTAMAQGGDANEFDRYVTQVVEKVFPQYKLVDLPADHPLRTCHFKLMPNVKLKAISNGVRLLWVHSPKDVALAWQRRDIKRDASTFELGMNLFVYASGKRDFRHRVSLAAIPDPGKPELGIVRVGRLSYPGNSGPEPGAWQRFCRIFQWKTGTGIELATIEMKNLKPAEVTVAHLTGTAAYALTQPEIAAISGFVDAGGVLLIDDAGGSGAFANAIEPAFAAALPLAARLALTPDHPLLAGGEPGMANQVRLKLRLWSTEKGVGPRGGTIQLYRSGKGAVVFCPIDLTTGLLGVNTWGINGYEPVSAEALVRNVVLWAMDGKF